MNCLDAAAEVLRQAGEPLHYKEITDRALEQGLWHTRGKTPDMTVNARLSVDIIYNADTLLARHGRGVYGLREWAQAAKHRDARASAASASVATEEAPQRTRTRTAHRRTMNCLDAAAEVLRQAGTALHYEEIVRRAVEQGLWHTRGSTPGATLTAALGREISEAPQPRFVRSGRGTYGLRELEEDTIARTLERDEGRLRQPVRDAATSRRRTACLDAAVSVLTEAGEPLHFEDIVRRALDQGLWRTTGRTPGATLTSAIGREIKADGDAARFVRFGGGMYGLRGFQPPVGYTRSEGRSDRSEIILHALRNEIDDLQEFLRDRADQDDAQRRLPFWVELCHRGGDCETAVALAAKLSAETVRDNPRLLEIIHAAHAGRLARQLHERKHVLDFCHDLRQKLRLAGLEADALSNEYVRGLLLTLDPCPLEGDEVVPPDTGQGDTGGKSGGSSAQGGDGASGGEQNERGLLDFGGDEDEFSIG